MVNSARQLSGSVAFGTSMLPFFGPGKDIWFEIVPPESIRIGDIITYREKPEVLISHRVIKILKKKEGAAFMTKGDNRFAWDPVVEKDQIVGRVTHIGNCDLKRFWWQWSGRLIAWTSYAQGTVYQCLKRLFPKVRAHPLVYAVGNPLSWFTHFGALMSPYRVWADRQRLAHQGIRIKTWTHEDTEAMLNVWNQVFPDHRTSPERFAKQICGSRLFHPSNCFLIYDRKKLIGWSLVALREDRFSFSSKTRSGFVDVLAMTPVAFEKRVLRVLIDDMLKCFKKNGIKKIFIGPHPIDSGGSIIPLTSLSTTLANAHFKPTRESLELRLQRSRYRAPVDPVKIEGLGIRLVQETDASALCEFFNRNHEYFDLHGGTKNALLAILNHQIIAYCRLLTDEQITDYGDLSWAWSAAEPGKRTGYFFELIVDQNFRRKSVGSALARKAFEWLFQSGCEEIALSVKQEGFYEDFYKRFGFQRKGRYCSWKRI